MMLAKAREMRNGATAAMQLYVTRSVGRRLVHCSIGVEFEKKVGLDQLWRERANS
jgi:hypothetical protein